MNIFNFNLPTNWSIVDLPDLVFYQEGPGVRNNQYTSSGVKLLNVANLQEGKLVLGNTDRYISEEEAYGRYKHFLVDEGDLIVASSGIKVEYFDKKMGFVKKEHLPLCMNTSTIRFKSLDSSVLDIRYFMYFLKSNYFKKQLQRLITGSAQLNFGPSHLKQIKVILPDISTQKYIVALLDKSQDLIMKRKAQIEALDQLTQSVFLEMFGDVRKNEKSWKASRLEDLCEYIIDCPHSTPKYSSYQTEYACIRTSELVNGYINWESMKYVNIEEYEKRIQRLEPQYGDIVYGREGTFGEAIIIPKDQKICLGQRVMLFRPDYSKCNSVFLWAMVRSKGVYYQAVSKMSGSTVGHVNVKDIKKFNVFLPPLELQNQFAVIIDKIDAQRKLLKQSYEELLNNYNSLMQRAFKGELFTEEKVSNL